MKTSEPTKVQIDDTNTVHELVDMRISECDRECQKRGRRNLVILSLVFIMLLVAGYFIHPGTLRSVWLIASGTLAVITGFFLLLIQVRVISLKC
jgi:protein-S-isoprenylcysteine O-methyltransferase Ste14